MITDTVSLLAALTPLITAIGVLATVLLQIWNNAQSAHHAEMIATLEKNTNSIKDALVKVTGEAAMARGVLQGRAEVIEAQDLKK